MSVPVVMGNVEDMRNGILDEGSAPDSWEMVDLDESMKKLLASSAVPSVQVSEELLTSDVNKSVTTALPPSSTDHSNAVRDTDQVDSFLKEALQNPRDRLTILRLEQEVERFVRHPNLGVLEFQPMPSSYLRLAAHRVAQHYFLQSMVVDGGSQDGSRIVARKTIETRLPTLRLVDIPVAPYVREQEHSKAVVVQVTPSKVAIKQRPAKGDRINGIGPCGNGGSLNPSKSVEERKEEYNKARARIFCNDLSGKVGEAGSENVFSVMSLIPETPPQSEFVKDERLQKVRHPQSKSTSVSPSKSMPVSSPISPKGLQSKEDKEDFTSRGNLNSLGSIVNGGSRVAIFRDREKDRRDPDYDRSTARYGQRFDPGFGVSVGAHGGQALYAPLSNYNTEFPQLGVSSRGHLHMDPLQPQSVALQQLRVPWIPRANAFTYHASDSMIGPYNSSQLTPTATYLRAPHYAYPGHSMNYAQHPDHFQHSQQSHAQQPDTSVNQARRR